MNTDLNVDSNIKNIEYHSHFAMVELGDFDEEATTTLSSALIHAQDGNQDFLAVTIDSYGGDAYALMGILDMWDASKLKIMTVARSKAISAGAIALAFGEPGYRFISPRCTYMLHDLSTTISGKPNEIKSAVKHIDMLQDRLYVEMAMRCGQEQEFFLKMLKDGGHSDIYLTPEQVLEYGIVDYIGIPTLRRTVSTKVELCSPDGKVLHHKELSGVSSTKMLQPYIPIALQAEDE